MSICSRVITTDICCSGCRPAVLGYFGGLVRGMSRIRQEEQASCENSTLLFARRSEDAAMRLCKPLCSGIVRPSVALNGPCCRQL